MIANPIIRKEVLQALRTRKAVAMQGLFLLVTAALLMLLWPAGGLQDVGGQRARLILSVLAIGQLVMVALFAPAFTASSLTIERERNTLESLFATAMRPWEVALGKLVGSLAFLVLLVLSGAPALAAPFLLGGVSPQEVLAILGLLLLTAIYLGMIGLLISTVMHRSYRAIITTYVVLLFVFFLFALPAWPISKNLITRGGPAWQAVLHLGASLSPLEAMMSLVWPDSPYVTGAQDLPAFWQLYIALSLLVIIATTALCLYKLRRPVAPPRPREKLKVVERGQISARTFFFVIDPRKRKKPIRWWQNPMLIKEFRTRPMLQGQWLLRAFGAALIASVLLLFLVSLSVQAFVAESTDMISTMVMAVAALMVVLIVLIGPAAAAGALCTDRETGVWDLIRTTRLSSWRIATGKFWASITPVLLLAVAATPSLIVSLYFKTNLWPNVVRVLYVVGTTMLFVTMAGMCFSSFFSRTSTATAWTYALVVSLGLISLLVLLGEGLFSRRFIQTVFYLNPVAAALAAAGSPTMQGYGLLIPHLKVMGAATAALFVITVVQVIRLRRPD